jgi:hypothetical protein
MLVSLLVLTGEALATAPDAELAVVPWGGATAYSSGSGDDLAWITPTECVRRRDRRSDRDGGPVPDPVIL